MRNILARHLRTQLELCAIRERFSVIREWIKVVCLSLSQFSVRVQVEK